MGGEEEDVERSRERRKGRNLKKNSSDRKRKRFWKFNFQNLLQGRKNL